MSDEANPFESLQEQIDDAAAYLDVDDDVIQRLKYPERVLETNLTVDMEDGSHPSSSGTSSHSGDEVVLLDPAWVSYEAIAKLAGADLTRVDLGQHDFDLEPALDDLAAAISDETSMLILNSPSNPTGAVFSDAALEGVRDLAVEHDVTVVADEIYDRITFDADPTSLASFDGMAERTVTVNGFSKAYSMTGWRLGWVAASERRAERMLRVHQYAQACASAPAQHAAEAALTGPQDVVEDMVTSFEERRDVLLDGLEDMGLDVPTPEGAFYAMPNVPEGWVEEALDRGVVVVPGDAFGANGEGYARISYATDLAEIREALDVMREATAAVR